MDLHGLVKVQHRGGKNYILVIVDDFSRYSWTMFLSSKDEIFEVLVIFSKKIQVKLGKQNCMDQVRSWKKI